MLHAHIAQIEQLFRGVLPWYASLYDRESGGFYGTISGRDDPALRPGLEMSGSVLVALHDHTEDLWAQMPAPLRKRFVSFFYTRYNVQSGYFEEPAMIPCDRDTADRFLGRIQAFSKKSLTALGEPFMPPTVQHSAPVTPVLPEQFASPEQYVAWMKTLSWHTNSWAAADRVQASQNYLRLMDDTKRQPYLDKMFAYLEETQRPETGYWGDDDSYCSLSSAFKVDLIYSSHKRPLPNPERILHSVFYTIAHCQAENAYYVRNALDLLLTLSEQHGQTEVIRAQLPQYLNVLTAAMTSFLAPDGGFSAVVGEGKTIYGGVRMGHGNNEGDIDATLMMLIARRILYRLFDEPIPPLSAFMPHFWAAFPQ